MTRKVAVVARREFLTTIRRPSYLISTLGMPLFALIIGAISIIPAMIMAKKERAIRTVGIVDASSVLGLDREIEFSPPSARDVEEMISDQISTVRTPNDNLTGGFGEATTVKLRPFPTREEGLKALGAKEVRSLAEFPSDYLVTGKVKIYQLEGALTSGGPSGTTLLRRFVTEKLLEGRLNPDTLERVRAPMRVTTFTVNPDGTFQKQDLGREVLSFAVPIVFAVLFFISIMISSSFLLQGVSEEKENRVIEVILSSIRAEDLLTGKLIGLGSAGLLQIATWLGIVVLFAVPAFPSLRLSPAALLASVVFYLLGFLLYGVLMTGMGALGQNLKEGQQYATMWGVASAVPMMFMWLLISEPNGVLARTLSFIPLTAPSTMFLRLHGSAPPPWWEVLLATIVLAVSVWIAIKAMAKMFRIGLLLYGKSPTIPEIVRLMRRPAS